MFKRLWSHMSTTNFTRFLKLNYFKLLRFKKPFNLAVRKPGTCPTPTGFGICIMACQGDDFCAGNLKCVNYFIFNFLLNINHDFDILSAQMAVDTLVNHQSHFTKQINISNKI